MDSINCEHSLILAERINVTRLFFVAPQIKFDATQLTALGTTRENPGQTYRVLQSGFKTLCIMKIITNWWKDSARVFVIL